MRTVWNLALAIVLVGCGGGKESREDRPLRFETLDDTAALTRGAPLLTAVEPYRMDNGVVRVRGRLGFPDGTRVQITLRRSEDHAMVARLHVIVHNGRFDSPPIIGERGPLPRDRYTFEYLTFFTDAWQTRQVLDALGGGHDLRGPGITRDRLGRPAFRLVEERRL